MKYNIQSKILLIAALVAAAPAVWAKPVLELPAFIYDGRRFDARAAGMGDAFVSVADNPSAAYWNPAGIKLLGRNYFFACMDMMNKTDASKADLYANDSLEDRRILGLGLAAKEGAFTFMPLTDYSRIFNNREINLKVNKYTMSAASESSQNMLVGVTISYLSGNIGVVDMNNLSAKVSGGNGAALDWGLLYKMNDNVRIGFDAQNAPGYIWWDEYEHQHLKPRIQTGFSVRSTQWFMLAVEYENKNVDFKRKDFYHAGMEQNILGSIFIREGVILEKLSDTKSKKNIYTYGIGYAFTTGFTADVSAKIYKLGNAADDTADDYLFSLNLPF